MKTRFNLHNRHAKQGALISCQLWLACGIIVIRLASSRYAKDAIGECASVTSNLCLVDIFCFLASLEFWSLLYSLGGFPSCRYLRRRVHAQVKPLSQDLLLKLVLQVQKLKSLRKAVVDTVLPGQLHFQTRVSRTSTMVTHGLVVATKSRRLNCFLRKLPNQTSLGWMPVNHSKFRHPASRWLHDSGSTSKQLHHSFSSTRGNFRSSESGDCKSSLRLRLNPVSIPVGEFHV